MLDRRKALILLAAGAGLWIALPRMLARRGAEFDFEAVADPPGFRRLLNGADGVSTNPLIGLDQSAARPEVALQTREQVCTALFGRRPPSDVVPIAFFTDYNCPYCRVLKERLLALHDASQGRVALSWHEWPLLGPSSETFARAGVAAGLQGAHGAFQARLRSGRVLPTPAYLQTLARDIGIDPARLLADMDSARVSMRLAETSALANRLGFVGTPGLVVGRTIVTGAMSRGRLEALVARERAVGPPAICDT